MNNKGEVIYKVNGEYDYVYGINDGVATFLNINFYYSDGSIDYGTGYYSEAVCFDLTTLKVIKNYTRTEDYKYYVDLTPMSSGLFYYGSDVGIADIYSQTMPEEYYASITFPYDLNNMKYAVGYKLNRYYYLGKDGKSVHDYAYATPFPM